MNSRYSHLYTNQNVIARKLFPDDIKPVFLTGDGINNFAQYIKNDKLYSCFFNLDRVLMEYEDALDRKILFDNGYAINVENLKYCLSDVNLIMRSTIAELLSVEQINKKSRVVGIANLKNFDLKVIAFQNNDLKYNQEKECYLAFYRVNDCKLYNPLIPEYIQTIKVTGGVNNIISLDEKMATFYTSPMSESRVVSANQNFAKKYNKPNNFSNSPSITREKFETTGIILIFHNNWELVTYFDYTKKIIISTYETKSNDAVFQYFIKSKMYNQLYQMPAFQGHYNESMNFSTLQQTQVFNIGGFFDDKAIIYNLTSEILTVDGYFIRGTSKAVNNVSRIEITLNNFAILNDYYVVFYIRAFDAAGAPAPFVNITVSIPMNKIPEENPDDDHNGDKNDLRRYFDPVLGGSISDSAKTDIDGSVYLFVKSINADVADHLQGYWWFRIDASTSECHLFDEVVNYHKTTAPNQTSLSSFRDEIRAKYNPDLPFVRPHFTQNF